jgi:hypothetical protein
MQATHIQGASLFDSPILCIASPCNFVLSQQYLFHLQSSYWLKLRLSTLYIGAHSMFRLWVRY